VTLRRFSLALSSGLLCAGLPITALADDAPAAAAGAPSPAPSAAAKTSVGAVVQPPTPLAVEATATAGATSSGPTTDTSGTTSEDGWVAWNTGEKDANMGFAIFGHLGLGHRFNDPPAAAGEVSARNGIRVGVTAIFRPIRWFGFGVGYEHADLDRDRADIDEVSYRTTFRDMNTLWIDARAYPLRFDPVALYVNIAGGPTWQGLESDSVEIDLSNPSNTLSSQCDGTGGAGFAMKGAVGAEVALVSGAILWGEFGPDYYLLSEDTLEGCTAGAGNAGMIGFRAGFAIGFERTKIQKEAPPKPADTDLDTILDAVDACPTVAGVPDPDPAKNGCPPPSDKDKDGIFDEFDACPEVAGIADPDPKKNGCPPPSDKDGDGVIDELDACVDIAGVKTEDPKTNGCPPDTDGDGFRDDQDACPQEKGVDDADPTKRGCPKLVRVTDTEIIILEQVQFDTGKATIKPASDPLLDSVAQVLKEHPEILKLEVQGHTDNKGSAALNKKLSQDRADSVRKALEKRGVEAGRMVGKGFGPDKPIADNKDDAGRQKNRRVQFVVLEKKPKPVLNPAAPATGPLPVTPPAATPIAPEPAKKP
jgi:OOP family OmpA-OmpF porin